MHKAMKENADEAGAMPAAEAEAVASPAAKTKKVRAGVNDYLHPHAGE